MYRLATPLTEVTVWRCTAYDDEPAARERGREEERQARQKDMRVCRAVSMRKSRLHMTPPPPPVSPNAARPDSRISAHAGDAAPLRHSIHTCFLQPKRRRQCPFLPCRCGGRRHGSRIPRQPGVGGAVYAIPAPLHALLAGIECGDRGDGGCRGERKCREQSQRRCASSRARPP